MNKVQFNLLPDVKADYISAQRTRNTVITISGLVAALSLGIFVLLFFTVNVLQKKQLSDADKKTSEVSAQIDKIENLSQILTVQNQLATLPKLHQQKHISSRIFTYLPEVTPANVNIGRLSLDFGQNTMVIDGRADSQRTVNTFIDTLKFTTYTVGSDKTAKAAFPTVVLTSFGGGGGSVGYTLNIKFDPVLFQNNLTDGQDKPIAPVLNVPSLTTTRSVLDDPSNFLFNGQLNNPRNQER